MFGIMVDGIWLFISFAALVIGYFVSKDISMGEFMIGMIIWYIGGQWLIDRRTTIIADYIELEMEDDR